MSDQLILAMFAGLGFGAGLWMIVLSISRLRVRSLERRVAPWIADINPAAYQLVADDILINVGWMPMRGYLRTLTSWWNRLRPSTRDLERALRQLGSAETASDQRARVIIWGSCSAAASLVVLLLTHTTVTVWAWWVVPLLAATLGGFVARMLFQRRVRRRVTSITIDLPTAMEFLALSLTAGESFAAAFRRVAQKCGGALGEELRGVQLRVDAGIALTTGLDQWMRDLQIPAVTRVFSQVLTAYERGTPMSSVLREQADELRHDKRNRLVELAAKKEVAMLIPLVFIILPTTVIFAVYPGLIAIQAGFLG